MKIFPRLLLLPSSTYCLNRACQFSGNPFLNSHEIQESESVVTINFHIELYMATFARFYELFSDGEVEKRVVRTDITYFSLKWQRGSEKIEYNHLGI